MPESSSLTDPQFLTVPQAMCLTTAGACSAPSGDGGGPNGPGGSGVVRYQAWERAPGAASDPRPTPGRSVAQQMRCGVGAFAAACDALERSLISSSAATGVANTTGWEPPGRSSLVSLQNGRPIVREAILRFVATYADELAMRQWDFLFDLTEKGNNPWALAQLEFGDFVRPAAVSLGLLSVGTLLNSARRDREPELAGGWGAVRQWEGQGRNPMRLTVYAAPPQSRPQSDGKWGRLTPELAAWMVERAAGAVGVREGPVTIGLVSAAISAAAYRGHNGRHGGFFFTLEIPF